MLHHRINFYVFTGVTVLILSIQPLRGQVSQNQGIDTLHLTPDSMVVFQDSVFIPSVDTTLLIQNTIDYKIRKNPYKNSRDFYDSLYYKTRDSKIERGLYDLLISYKPPKSESKPDNHRIAKNEFLQHEGKYIGNIRFVKVDIMEGSVEDTTKISGSGFSKLLNNTHMSTRDWVLKKYMLVESGDKIIPAIIADNERIIRQLPGIEDCRIIVQSATNNSDTANLIVITQDNYPIAVSGAVSGLDKFDVQLSNNNFTGLGLELGAEMIYDSQQRLPWGYSMNTIYKNIAGTYINNRLSWIDASGRRQFTAGFSRGFVTPRTKYGGGFEFGWIKNSYELPNGETTLLDYYESDFQDIWIGRSFLPWGEQSRTNLFVSARFEREGFTRRPYIEPDSNVAFHNKKIYYGKVGIIRTNYYKTTMIRSFGTTEDIPYGYNSSLTLAYLEGDFLHRLYVGANVGGGRYFPHFGYFRANLLAGGFYRNGGLSQGILETDFFYYTPLVSYNRYSFRNFFRMVFRQSITKDVHTTFDFGEHLREIDQNKIEGKATLTVNYEFVLFTPWYFYGFRFAPFIFIDAGLISPARNVFYKSRFYSAPGIGFRIRNESLAFKNFIISFGFLPGAGQDDKHYFYNITAGEDGLIPSLQNQRPYILKRELIFPY